MKKTILALLAAPVGNTVADAISNHTLKLVVN